MSQFLTQFPAAWGLLGTAVASVAFIFANRYIFQWQREATEGLRTSLVDRIKALQVERDEYREKLHEEKDEHNLTSLRCRELELRPDMTDVKGLLEQQSAVLKGIMDAFDQHSREDAAVFRKIIDALDRLQPK